MEQYLTLLMHILENSGFFGKLDTSTTKMAKELDLSQQSVSRKLIEMEEKSLIKKETNGNGIIVSLDNRGREYIENIHSKLCNSVKKPVIKGKTVEGLGEGQYYMSLKQYVEKFKEKLGFEPFPGTFNLEIEPEKVDYFLNKIEPIVIEGFNTEERTYGGLDCYKAELRGKEVFIAKPHRSNHPENIIELIAPFNIRKELGIRENEKVEVKV